MSAPEADSISSQESDEALAARARAGSRESFEQLVIRFQVRLLRFLQRRVRTLADAEDLLQETFVRAYERLDSYDELRPFGTWLFTIAQRLAVSHLRHHQVVTRASDILIDQQRNRESIEPGHALADDESRQHFWEQASSVLSAEQFSAVWLFYVEGMPAPQIADVLGRSWVSVKTILFRARRKLVPLLTDEAESGEKEPAPARRSSGMTRGSGWSPAL